MESSQNVMLFATGPVCDVTHTATRLLQSPSTRRLCIAAPAGVVDELRAAVPGAMVVSTGPGLVLRLWMFVGFSRAEIFCLSYGHDYRGLKLLAYALRGRVTFINAEGSATLGFWEFLRIARNRLRAAEKGILLVGCASAATLERLQSDLRHRFPNDRIDVFRGAGFLPALIGGRFPAIVIPWTREGHTFLKLGAWLLPSHRREIYNENGDWFPASRLSVVARHFWWRANAWERAKLAGQRTGSKLASAIMSGLLSLGRSLLSVWRRLRPAPTVSYSQRMQDELARYKDVEVVHDLPQIFHIWSDKYVRPKLEEVLGVSNFTDFYTQYVVKYGADHPGECVEIASLGAGNGDLEIELATVLRSRGFHDFKYLCLDINPDMLQRGRELAAQKNVAEHFEFLQVDVATWKRSKPLAIVMANQALHHMVPLEDIFANIKRLIGNDGYFLTSDMIGRNGHMRWPEALEVVNEIWRTMPDRYKYNHQLRRFEAEYDNWDCSKVGFEGIRAQDILPLLLEQFAFEAFAVYGNVIDLFVDRCFGPNLDPNNPEDVEFILRVSEMDEELLDSGKVKPTHMTAVMRARPTGPVRCYRHWTPQFCVRPVSQSAGARLPVV